MNKIENAEQLRTEIYRLKNIASQQQEQIKNDVKAIREDLKPENIIWNTLSSITGIKINKSDFFKEGIAVGIYVLIQRFILKKERNIQKENLNFSVLRKKPVIIKRVSMKYL